MSQSLDRVLEVIDRGLATAPTSEPAYGTDYHPDLCWRCQSNEPGEGASGVCDGCRALLLDETSTTTSPSTVGEYRRHRRSEELSPAAWLDGLYFNEPNRAPYVDEDISAETLLAFGRAAAQAGEAMQTIARAFNDWIREIGPAIARIHAQCVEWGLLPPLDAPPVPPVPFKRNAHRYGRGARPVTRPAPIRSETR